MSTLDKIILAVDVGSSSIRCSAYLLPTEQQCQVRAISGCSSSTQMQCVRPNTGKVNMLGDARTGQAPLLDAIDGCVDSTLEKLRDHYRGESTGSGDGSSSRCEVMGVGFSTFVMNLVGVDEKGQILDEAASVTYACNAPRVADECRKLRREVGPDILGNLYERTGAPLHSAYALPQFRELYSNGDVRVHRWQSVASLCLSRWTGVSSLPISFSEASWTGLLDFRTCQWDEEAISLLPDDCQRALPDLGDCTDASAIPGGISEFLDSGNGTVRKHNPYWTRWPELRGQVGDRKHYCRLFLGIGDGACANIGSKCSTPSRLAVTIGTSAAARVCLPLPIVENDSNGSERHTDPNIKVPFGLFCYRVDRSHVLVGGALTDGGSVIEWARSLLNLQSSDAFEKIMEDVTRQYEEEVEQTGSEDTAHLTLVPFLSGERSTGFRDGANGCMTGLTRQTTPAHFVKACLEGVILRMNAIVGLISETASLAPSSSLEERKLCIVASGNALERNALWRRMLADCSGCPVLVDSEISEGTSRGAARLVAAALLPMAGETRVDLATPFLLGEEELKVSDRATPRDQAMAAVWSKKSASQDCLIDAASSLWG